MEGQFLNVPSPKGWWIILSAHLSSHVNENRNPFEFTEATEVVSVITEFCSLLKEISINLIIEENIH